jgi:hypothetical protein
MVFRYLGCFDETLRSHLAMCTYLPERATYMGEYDTTEAVRDEDERPLL